MARASDGRIEDENWPYEKTKNSADDRKCSKQGQISGRGEGGRETCHFSGNLKWASRYYHKLSPSQIERRLEVKNAWGDRGSAISR